MFGKFDFDTDTIISRYWKTLNICNNFSKQNLESKTSKCLNVENQVISANNVDGISFGFILLFCVTSLVLRDGCVHRGQYNMFLNHLLE